MAWFGLYVNQSCPVSDPGEGRLMRVPGAKSGQCFFVNKVFVRWNATFGQYSNVRQNEERGKYVSLYANARRVGRGGS